MSAISSSSELSSESDTVSITDETEKLRFEATRCALYHEMRVGFFEFWGKSVTLFAFLSSSLSVATKLANYDVLLQVFLAVAAISSGLNIVVGFSTKARDHAVLRSKYYNFLADLEKEISFEDIRTSKARIQVMYAEGPAFLSSLNVVAYNRTIKALGRNQAYLLPFGFWEGSMAQVFSFSVSSARPTKQEKNAAKDMSMKENG